MKTGITAGVFSAFIALSFIFYGCNTTDQVQNGRNIQKRKYNRGWHVDFASHAQKLKPKSAPERQSVETVSFIKTNEQTMISFPEKHQPEMSHTASLHLGPVQIFEPTQVQERKAEQRKPAKTRLNNCDIITLLNGTRIETSILEVKVDDIRYTKCDANNDSPAFLISKMRFIPLNMLMDFSLSLPKNHRLPTIPEMIHTMLKILQAVPEKVSW